MLSSSTLPLTDMTPDYKELNIHPETREDIVRLKSNLNQLVVEANIKDRRIVFPALDRIIRERNFYGCSHHMISCKRFNDKTLELLYHCKAVESSTDHNRGGEILVSLLE
jgi:hypothetical protein